VAGGQYEVKLERGQVFSSDGEFSFEHTRGRAIVKTRFTDFDESPGDEGSAETAGPDEVEFETRETPIAEGQSAVPLGSTYFGLHELWNVLRGLQIVEINPSRVRDFQDPGPVTELEPDGSNSGSVFEALSPERRAEVVDYLGAVVPGIVDIEPRRISNKLTLQFYQDVAGRRRQFYANQMSDGTLRAFGVILALLQSRTPKLTVIEEPETAIHLGALRTLVDLLQQHSKEVQVLITTHSADIIDALDVRQLRVVSSDGGASRLAAVAEHTIDTLREGLITPGELLRADALDPAIE
jgi:predicted ATPase